MIEVVLVDDHPSIRLGVTELLRDAGMDVVGEAATAAEGIERVEQKSPDVAIVDLELPDENGAALVRSIKARFPSVACLVYSAGANVDVITDAIAAGAAGFVSKGSRSADLVEAVRVVAAGGETFPSELTDRLVDTLRDRSRAVPIEELSAQEDKVLILLGEGLSNREIADRLRLAEKTVRNHVSKLLRKLGLRDRTQAALYAVRRRG